MDVQKNVRRHHSAAVLAQGREETLNYLGMAFGLLCLVAWAVSSHFLLLRDVQDVEESAAKGHSLVQPEAYSLTRQVSGAAPAQTASTLAFPSPPAWPPMQSTTLTSLTPVVLTANSLPAGATQSLSGVTATNPALPLPSLTQGVSLVTAFASIQATASVAPCSLTLAVHLWSPTHGFVADAEAGGVKVVPGTPRSLPLQLKALVEVPSGASSASAALYLFVEVGVVSVGGGTLACAWLTRGTGATITPMKDIHDSAAKAVAL